MGSIWVEKGFYNHGQDRYYQKGDVLACFFGMLFGMMTLGMALPNIKAVTEGKAAGKMVFDTINRKPEIDQDDPNAKVLDSLHGDIEFRDVDFYYPTRPDTQALTKFSYKFEAGKTTAIVGPSGSGKSTII